VLDIVVHKNVRLLEFIVSDILDSDHKSFFSNAMDHLRTRNLSDAVDKFTDWERFQSLASVLISPRIPVNLWEEADKAVRDFTASTVSAYGLSTNKLTVSGQNNELPGLECLLKHKMRLRKL
jgi:hypothetical protein